MVSSITSLNSFEAYSSSFLKYHNDRLSKLNEQKSQLTARLSLYTELKSRFTSFDSGLTSFTESQALSSGGGNTVSLSSLKYFTAEVTDQATTGITTVAVNQLATQDSVISRELTNTGTELADISAKKETFFIQGGNGQSKKITVNIDAADNNATVLQNVADAINTGSTGDIQAEVVNTSGTTARLSIKAVDTGESQAIILDNGNGDLLFSAGLDLVNTDYSRKETTGAGGGSILADITDLNAQLTVNGIALTRETNTVDDALTGITLRLNAAQSSGESPVTVSVQSAAVKAREEIESFISDYNGTINYLNNALSVNPNTLERGSLSFEYAFRNLRMDLRSIAGGNIAPGTSGDPRNLHELGISISTTGTLSIADSDKLNTLLDSDMGLVQQVLIGDGSIGARLSDTIDSFASSTGFIRGREKLTTNRLSSTNQRIQRVERNIRVQETLLKRQFAAIQRTVSKLMSQQQSMNSIYGFGNNLFSLFNSL
jgi:flagellar hook-associated protein 2